MKFGTSNCVHLVTALQTSRTTAPKEYHLRPLLIEQKDTLADKFKEGCVIIKIFKRVNYWPNESRTKPNKDNLQIIQSCCLLKMEFKLLKI